MNLDLLAFQHFHFLRPYWIVLLPAFYLVIQAFKSRDDSLKIWKKLISKEILSHITISGSSKQLLTPQRLFTPLFVLVVLIAMGPTWKQQPSPFSENDSALIIALDVSETMLQSDVQPSRLLRAKQKIIELLEIRGDTKTALIAFTSTAHTVMPITNDREMIRHFLDVLEPDIMPRAGKLPESILPVASNLLNTTSVPGTILLITDGVGDNAIDKFSDFFDKANHQLIVWGIGNNNAESLDSSLVKLQTDKLKELSSQSDGRYVELAFDKQDVN